MDLMNLHEYDNQLPPGFRFHPSDEELIRYYLHNKLINSNFTSGPISQVVDLNKCEPWQLPEKAKMGEKEWYMFSLRDQIEEWNQWILTRVFQKAMKINGPECKETRMIGSGRYSAEPSSSSSSSVSLPPLFDSSPYYPTNDSLTDRDSCSHDNRTPMEHVSCFSTNTGTSDDLMTSLDLQTSSLHGFGGLSDFPSSLGSLEENLHLPFLFSQGMQPHQPYYSSTTGSFEFDLGDWSSLGNWRAATAEEPEALAPVLAV
ncbi:hypothetical protein ACLB2K_027849 [Fragaria x ananassa]